MFRFSLSSQNVRIGFILFSLVILFAGCGKDNEDPSPENLSSQYNFCNSQLSKCTNGNGQYCLFGFKWGLDNEFPLAGYNAQGPQSSGGIVSYSFQEENGQINSHRQVALSSLSFQEILPCAKLEIRKAMETWSGVCDIEFVEESENSHSDIRFYVADIVQGGIGYPNYPDDLCSELSGNVLIGLNVGINDCDFFHLFILHEVGHVLGLGHVETENIMSPRFSSFNLSGLQRGDSLGAIEIYGER